MVAWVSCDRHDNDPAQLWSAVLHSLFAELQRVDGRPGTAVADRFAAMTPPQHDMEPAFLAEFVDAIDALTAPIAIVLDDAHELRSPTVLGGLDELLRNLPRRLLLFLGCRFDPPLSLSLPRLRVDGWLQDVRASDLAFSMDETRALLEAQHVTLPDDSTSLLLERTEGWPAALRLAALSLAEEPDPAAFITTFAGDQRGIADYLVAEVLSRQPDELHEFLVQTSVAEELPVDLAVSLSGRSDAGAILDRLERANALVTRLGPGRRWYRYHALLRSFLLAELRQRDVAAARALHATASAWFAAADMPDPALEHALTAGDGAGLLALLRRFALRQLLSGTGATVRDVLAGAPRDVADTPEAALIAGIDALEQGDLPGATRLLRSVDVAASSDDTWLVRLHSAVQLYLARVRGEVAVLPEPRQAVGSSDAAPASDVSSSIGDHDVELLVLANRGMLRIAAGDYSAARSDLTEALDLARRSRRDYLALECMSQLSGAAAAMSDLPATAREADRAIAFAAERGWGSSPRMAYAYTLAAWAAYQTLDLETATRWAPNAVGVMDGAMAPEVEAAARSADAVIAFDRPLERREALKRMRSTWTALESGSPSPALVGYAAMAELHMCLTLGELMWARAVVERVERMSGPGGDATVMRGRLLLHTNRVADARRTLAPLLRDGPTASVITNDVTCWLVEVVATARSGAEHNAHTALMTALALAEPVAALRPFYDMGEPVRALLVGATGRLGALDDFASGLLRAWTAAQAWQRSAAGAGGRNNDNGDPAARGHAPQQPLTARELEILRALPSMLTTEEIAEAHVVSVNTVKTHVKSIYRKLGVNSRREAVEAARLAGIL